MKLMKLRFTDINYFDINEDPHLITQDKLNVLVIDLNLHIKKILDLLGSRLQV